MTADEAVATLTEILRPNRWPLSREQERLDGNAALAVLSQRVSAADSQHSVLDQRWEIVQRNLGGLGLTHYDQATRALHSLRVEVAELKGQFEAEHESMRWWRDRANTLEEHLEEAQSRVQAAFEQANLYRDQRQRLEEKLADRKSVQ